MLKAIEKINAYHSAGLGYRLDREFDFALSIAHKNVEKLLQLGFSCLDIDDYVSALKVLAFIEGELGDDAQLKLAQNNIVSLHLFRAKLNSGIGNLKESQKYFDLLDPKSPLPEIRWSIGLNDLYRGRYERGWCLYEDRFNTHSNRILHVYPFKFPKWDGLFKQQGAILVHGEQGLGDEIMYASFIKELKARATLSGTTIYLASAPPVYELFVDSFPGLIHLKHSRGPQDVDAWESGFEPLWLNELPLNTEQISIGSLPHSLVMTLPAKEIYLQPSISQVTRFGEILSKKLSSKRGRKLRVGLAWCANLRTPFGQSKSIPVEMFSRLSCLPWIEFVGIQGHEYGHLVQRAPDLKIIDLHDYLTDLQHVAAIIQNLDLVVSVDTSYCHLAGALGKSCIALLKKGHDWRFGVGDASPFYLDMSLIRQTVSQDWAKPIELLESDLFSAYSRLA
jgi:hypothetical protein